MSRLPLTFDPERSLPEQVGEWLDEAALTLACLPATGLRPAGARSTWPAYLCDLEDLGWERESDEFLPRPTAEQIDRLDVVLGWIPLIEDRQQKTVVHMRMIRHPISGENRWKWEQIGKRLGVSNHTAKARFDGACALIARRLPLPRGGLEKWRG
ncbi:DUF6362 family protein [Asaia prunellae]|uniref:DUF6362 family protein n=1 Tax=Asaia prunellae TaxID=610245 RepID=UPI00047105FF|nr:DUF6362 family protein [Asaia prunellae]